MTEDIKTKLWKSADKLRAQVDPAEYKHIVLGLIFLKYISDKFEAQQEKIRQMVSDPASDYFISEDVEDYHSVVSERDEFLTRCVYALFQLMYVHTSVPLFNQKYLGR